MYNVKSNKAEEFIDDQEILDTIEYAKKNKNNRELIFSLIERAKDCKGLTHREAMLLLECDIPEAISEMEKVAKMIKDKLYGNRIVLFAPLYLSNYCINGCVYCPYHQKNKHIARKKLTQEEIKKEVKEDDLITIEDFKKVELVVGTVEECKKHPDADKLLVSKINLGKETRQIVSGIADYYSPEEFVGKKVIVVANLKPAKLRGVESQGMVLAGETKDLLEVINVENLPNGTKIR